MDIPTKISHLISDPYIFSDTLTVKELEDVIRYANKQYHNTDNPVMEDEHYDILKNILEKRSPDSKVLKEIGGDFDKNDKKNVVKLPYFMSSMDKIKSEKQVNNFTKKFNGPYFISDKLDGISLLFHRFINKNGDLIDKLYTRGREGIHGRDVTIILNALFTQSFLDKLPKKEFTVRGEVIMTKKSFLKFSKDYSKARSVSNAVVNAKTVKKELIMEQDYRVFKVYNPPGMSPSEQYKFVSSMGFDTPYHKILPSIDKNILSDILHKRRSKSNYVIDGIIVQHDEKYEYIRKGLPKSSIAFKQIMKENLRETVVLDVEWNMSRTGKLWPTVLFELVNIEGSNIQRASGKNAEFIRDNMIGPGSKIIVTLGGEVIPNIEEILTCAVPKFPKKPGESVIEGEKTYNWYWIDKKNIGISTLDNIEIKNKQIHFFAKTLKIAGIGPRIAEEMVANGIDTINILINSTEEKFLELNNVSEKSATKFFNGIQNAITGVNPAKIMTASQVFPESLGSRRFEKIFEKYPNFLNMEESKIEELVLKVDGFNKLSKSVAIGFPKFQHFMRNNPKITMSKMAKPVIVINKSKDNKFLDREFIFTGGRDNKLEEIIENNGGSIGRNVTTKTYLVVTKDVTSSSGKIKKAKKHGVKIISMDDFKKKYF